MQGNADDDDDDDGDDDGNDDDATPRNSAENSEARGRWCNDVIGPDVCRCRANLSRRSSHPTTDWACSSVSITPRTTHEI